MKSKTTTALLILTAATPALAQDAPPPAPPATSPQGEAQRRPAVDPQTGRPLPEPAGPTAVESAEEAARRMYLGGGSLMQAQLQAQQASNAAVGLDPRVGFFAVPEPTPTVIRKNDLVTVVVREESAAKSVGKLDVKKQASIKAAIDQYVALSFRSLSLQNRTGDDGVAASAQAQLKGDGTVDRKDSFVTRLTARVLDVKPNGTVVIEARRRIVNDDEEQTFVLVGTCRTEDITPDNTVLSTQLHDLNLEKHTRGAVRDATRRGFIPRLLGRLNPF